MLPQAPPPPPRNSSRTNLLISLGLHAVVIAALVFFAACEGLLGRQLRKIAVELVKEKPPEKPKEPERPKPAPKPEIKPEPKPEPPKVAATPPVTPPAAQPRPAAPPPATGPSLAAPPPAAPPAVDLPAFVFEGGREVTSTSDPVQLYKGIVEYAFRANWNRPVDIADDRFVAEVDVAVDAQGQITDPVWKSGSGDSRWDASVRAAISATRRVNRPPPAGFPPRVLVRFDVEEVAEPAAR